MLQNRLYNFFYFNFGIINKNYNFSMLICYFNRRNKKPIFPLKKSFPKYVF
ncbi:hypothetical protein BAC_A0102 (plasmid) [Bacillus anthracis str. A0488]|uniref:Uncharacterized protein n=1 Tax=Bacillus anthracis TaxID=1392 RepID=Q6EZN1_BACAN|nr:hypothetical protein BX_A0147 [Bacillus anthracis str. A2012]AAT28888.2 hypothetical protein GBAA_pXO1_0147 [Bacillus anthracis str. 'Ames Ancestor']EDR16387.1 hypothetical protein BAC_A0102 [Bacillus anthracis str. A0488]EDR85332.1 hypothetical protein BAQ_A0200 [Bacillus anthracis str. A0193]EDR90515.1 hypothetical protein BAH_A0097 [Bacillus anthracis str. A0442]EDS94378.1 hypothetical protein BAK_A0045 [Bacillus anthracis str. A0389]EDT17059.1 hypothetical protein BAM_A0205 [Bacillus a